MKNISIFVCAILVIIICMPMAGVNVVAQITPVAVYHFDEGAGTSLGDSSGNGNTGTITNGAWVPGINGTALQFSGNGYVTLGTTFTGTVFTSLTVQAWINPENTTGPKYIFYDGSDGEFVIWQNGNACGITAKINGVAEKWVTAHNSIEFNKWQMVTGVFTGSELVIYVNGVLKNSTSVPANGLYNPGGNYYPTIGAYCDASSNHNYYFNGAIDEVNVWNRVLNASEIQQNYEKFNSLVGYWPFDDGDGTIGNPYIITNVQDLQAMNTNKSLHYALGNDIDASITLGWNGGSGFIPIGSEQNRFTGSLDGLNHNITGLYIDRPTTDYVGLFGYVDTEGIVKNIGLINNDVTGALIVGGLAGLNNGRVTDTFTTGNVIGTDKGVGGLIGKNWLTGIVTNSFATGTVTGMDEVVGGLLGTNSGTVNCSFATGDVSGYNGIGGFVGDNWESTITNCYATGSVSHSSGSHAYFGGFVGNNGGGEITNCYSTGRVSLFTSKGFAGTVSMDYQMTGNFWDTETSGQTSTAGVAIGKTTAQMKNQSTFTTVNWDFDNIWWMDGGTYPLLQETIVNSQIIGDDLTEDPIDETLTEAAYLLILSDSIEFIQQISDESLLYLSSYAGGYLTEADYLAILDTIIEDIENEYKLMSGLSVPSSCTSIHSHILNALEYMLIANENLRDGILTNSQALIDSATEYLQMSLDEMDAGITETEALLENTNDEPETDEVASDDSNADDESSESGSMLGYGLILIFIVIAIITLIILISAKDNAPKPPRLDNMPPPISGPPNNHETLRELKAMLDEGLISEDDYEFKKSKILEEY